jgi:hypothetical protein
MFSELMEEADRLERPGVIHKIASMYMQGAGVKNIATEVGARPGSVRNLVNRKVFKDIVAGFSEDIVQACKNRLTVCALEAVNVFADAMHSANEKVRLKAADGVLTKIGVAATTKVEINNKIAEMLQFNNLSDEQLAQALIDRKDKHKTSNIIEGDGYIVDDAGNEVGGGKEESL